MDNPRRIEWMKPLAPVLQQQHGRAVENRRNVVAEAEFPWTKAEETTPLRRRFR
jgi:hypothetical protein